ncbi:MAG TPA: hypothetical protein GX513_14485 [Firmicutes bacterium]|nr:hypothetical protein [Bacillota bacterium]
MGREMRDYQTWTGEPVYRLVTVGRRKSMSDEHLDVGSRPFQGRICLSLEILTPLHVGSGQLEIQRLPAEKLVAALPMGADSQAVIPGSSLKGAVRSLVEVISDSCFPVAHRDIKAYVPSSLNRCTDVRSLCPACRIFGTQGWAARVEFSDVPVPISAITFQGIPTLWQPGRSPQALRARYLRGNLVKGRKTYRHGKPAGGPDIRQCVKQNTVLKGGFAFHYVTRADLGLVLAAMGVGGSMPGAPPAFPIKIGGGKPVGYGSVSVKVVSVSVVDGAEGTVRHQGRMSGSSPSQAVGGFVKECVTAAVESQLVNVERWHELARALTAQHLKTDSPSRAY